MPKKLPALADVCTRTEGRPPPLVMLWSLVAVLLAASPAPGQDGLVMVDALVVDRDGNPVPGLNRGDFEIMVGDRIGPVAGVRMATPATDTRRFVFVLNRRGALPAQLQRVKEGLAEFVSTRFRSQDEALVIDFAAVPRITRGWRQGPGDLLPEVENIPAMGFRSALGPAEDAADAAFMLSALAERLRELPGRKVVVVFSGSLGTFAGNPGGDLEPVAPWGWADFPSSRAGSGRRPEPARARLQRGERVPLHDPPRRRTAPGGGHSRGQSGRVLRSDPELWGRPRDYNKPGAELIRFAVRQKDGTLSTGLPMTSSLRSLPTPAAPIRPGQPTSRRSSGRSRLRTGFGTSSASPPSEPTFRGATRPMR